METCSIYIHFPFCKSKCKYCAFVSFPKCENLIKKYVQKLKKELIFHKNSLKSKKISSIYLGGGTPSLVLASLIFDLLSFIFKNFNVESNAEITLEANPDSVTKKKAQIWKRAGVNRISIGLQSDNNETLKSLGRIHTFEKYIHALNIIKETGFTNISTDILLGLLNQTTDSIKQTIRKISNLGLKHISAYGLQVEQNTPLFKEVKSGKIILPSEDESVKIYNTAVHELKKFGFKRYEISNFAQKGFESKHNLNYWARGEYLGIGVGAYSFLCGEHFENTSNLEEYLSTSYKRKNVEKETTKTKKEETIMLALRTEKGLDISLFNKTFNTNFEEDYKTQIAKLTSKKLIKIVKNHVKITNFEISNQIIADFF